MVRAPENRALVELDQRLGELVEALVLASVDVQLDDAEPAELAFEAAPQRRREPVERAPPGRVESRTASELRADRVVLPRAHLLEHVE